MTIPVQWLSAPQAHDFPAATAYLQLTCGDAQIADIIARLKAAPTVQQKAKDLLRASRLELLPKGDSHVSEDLTKIAQGEALSPVLLVRGDIDAGTPLVIADGYHRVCASYYIDVNTDIPCRLVPAAPPGAPFAKPAKQAGGKKK